MHDFEYLFMTVFTHNKSLEVINEITDKQKKFREFAPKK